ncbi:MAG: hypothetical protein IK152_06150 [Lachnospiraceae bacterium]|nr:hypothetical protein [Lachnospiraceae bacterium]
MGLFGNKEEKRVRKELDGYIVRLQQCYSNKDNNGARQAYAEFQNAFAAAKASHILDEDWIDKYEQNLGMYKLILKL